VFSVDRSKNGLTSFVQSVLGPLPEPHLPPPPLWLLLHMWLIAFGAVQMPLGTPLQYLQGIPAPSSRSVNVGCSKHGYICCDVSFVGLIRVSSEPVIAAQPASSAPVLVLAGP
jgi:hypothetical protein